MKFKRKNNYDFVLDCSVTMAWLFKDESSSTTDRILDQLENSSAVVPAIWPLEVANVLRIAESRHCFIKLHQHVKCFFIIFRMTFCKVSLRLFFYFFQGHLEFFLKILPLVQVDLS